MSENINEKIKEIKEYILEKLVKLKKETSVIITRFGSQKCTIYDPIENVHEDQILKYSKRKKYNNRILGTGDPHWNRSVYSGRGLSLISRSHRNREEND